MKQALEKGPAQRSSFLNNYRALITAVGFLLTSLCMHAQFYDSTKLLQDVSAHGFRWKNSEFRSSLIVPTGTGLVKMANRDSGSIAYHNGIFYGNNGYAWNPIGNGAAVPTWQGTLLAPDGSILTQDNYVNAKGYNFIIDSLNYLRFENYATETVTNDPDYKISNGLELSDDINEGAHIYSSFTNNGSGLYKSELTIGSYQISLFAHDLLNDFFSPNHRKNYGFRSSD